MKKIEAYIKRQRLAAVIERLHGLAGLTGVSVFDIHGFGRSRGESEPVHIEDNGVRWVPHVKIEIVCRDELVEIVISAIQAGAHTGLRADGKVYVSPVEDAVRISTGERGETAV
ncbi:P-II family nitrogen regulator [candidate division WOR-3 bacterium]|uniref:P-II family nitrogen regulator n=1 Tax=candidate division WOR-3 bacterium TaxID=2052148 RepID=A0A938BSA1_UNCW3|nr:P-II family nitrogen regulator [candidate division WOR-3 bacterium]